MTKRLLVFLSLLALVGCGDQRHPTEPIDAPDAEILDGSRDPALAHFYFLAPMVWDEPMPTGTFDASLLPQVVVVVCELGESGCGPEVARFTADGPFLQRVIVSQFTLHGRVFEQYVALWRTDGPGVGVDKTYRATVSAPGLALGHADVKLVRTKEQAAAVDRTQFTPWVKGLPLPIRFRIEAGIVGQLQVAPAEATVAPGESQQFSASMTDLHGAPIDAEVSWASSDEAVALVDQTGLATAVGAGVATITATSQRRSASATLTVRPREAVALEVSGVSDPAVAGMVSSITVTARDVVGDVASGYAGTIGFTSGDPQATLPAEYTFTAEDAGTHVFPASVTLRTAGGITVTVTDQAMGGINGAQAVTVTPAAAAVLVLSGLPDPATAGVANDLTITARDPFGNTATGYAGTVQFSSTDPAAALPQPYQVQASDAGVRTFTGGVTFKTSGPRTLQTSDGTLSVSLAVAVDPAAASALRFTSQPSDALAGAVIAPPVVVTAYDPFGNQASGFTGRVTVGIETNPGTGVLSGDLQEAAALGVATFDDLSINAGGNGYTLEASAAGLTGATSEPFDITAPRPTEVRWINPVNGLWSDATKWSAGAVPTADQVVFIDVAGTYTVTLDVNASVSSLTVGAGSGTQTLGAGSGRILTLSTSGAILGTGRLTLSGATLNGPGTLTNAAGGVLTLLGSSTINATLENAGTLLVQNSSALNGGFSTVAGSLLRVQSIGFGGASLTVASGGFTNHGAIELTGTATNGCALTVNGTLLNAADGTIASLAGCDAGGRALNAQLENQGMLNVSQLLTLNRGSADHVNSGTIVLNADLVIPNQGGTSPSFTNLGTVTVAPGRTWFISNSSFTQATGATLDGGGAMSLNGVNPAIFNTAFTLGALSLQGTTITFATDITTATLALSVSNSTINGPIMLTNAATKTLTVAGTSVVNTPLVNAGTLVVVNGTTLNSSFTTMPGSLLRVQSIGFGGATLTVASGNFTNHAAIELTGTTANGVSFNVNGTLLNATDGTITSLVGSAGGGRTLSAQLDNQGTVTVMQALTLSRASADHVNSGTIMLNAELVIPNQGGTSPSFTNTGTVTVAPGRTWVISNSSFTQAAGATLDGGGAMSLNAVNPAVFNTALTLGALSLAGTTASFATDITTATLALSLSNSTVNGPITLTNAATKTLTLSGTCVINTPLVNAGTLIVVNSSTLNGSLSTAAGSSLEVRSVGFGGSTLNVAGASGFTNHGAIVLTGTTSNGVVLAVTGPLVNAPDGTITSLLGAGGGRTLTAQLDNQGTLSLSHSLAINRASATHTNSGTIVLNAGDLTITQSGTSPSLTNHALIDLVGTGTVRLNGGTFTNATSATIQGVGTFETGSTTPFTNSGSVTATLVRVGNALTGSGSFAPPTVEFFGSAATIPVAGNFAYTSIRVLSSAAFAGSRDLVGTLTVAGSGNLTIGAHEIVLEGDFATQGSGALTMQTPQGILNVRGNASFGGGSTNGRLTAGSLRVGGNFTQSGGSAAAFAASASHLTELDGPAEQTVFFANPGSATTASHFQYFAIVNLDGDVVLTSAIFANGQLSTPLAAQYRVLRSAGLTLTVGGFNAAWLVFDGTPLRVVNGSAITQFATVTFRNMDPTITQFQLDRLNDAVTFNDITFETVPTTGVYLHLVDTDGGGAALFTVTMQNTTPPSHGGKVIESIAGQLQGWPF